jgi:hypothetical protein
MNNIASKEGFLLPPPRLSVELVAFLDQQFPEKSPDPSQGLPEIFFQSGQRSVVRYLNRLLEEQEQ